MAQGANPPLIAAPAPQAPPFAVLMPSPPPLPYGASPPPFPMRTPPPPGAKAPGIAPAQAPGVAPAKAPGIAPAKAPGIAPAKAPGIAPAKAPGVAQAKAPGVAPPTAPGLAPAPAPLHGRPVYSLLSMTPKRCCRCEVLRLKAWHAGLSWFQRVPLLATSRCTLCQTTVEYLARSLHATPLQVRAMTCT